jgi:hypothetical protein
MTAQSMQDVAVSLTSLKDATVMHSEQVQAGISKLHDDNVRTAAVLASADSEVRRLVDTVEPPFKPPRRRSGGAPK